MGKINRNANIYDKDGNLLRHVNEDGYLEDYSIKELEDLVDKLAEDKDENGNVKDPRALNNASAILFQMYQKLGNPHEKDLLERLKEFNEKQTTQEQVEEKLNEVAEELDKEQFTDRETVYEPDTYIDYEEITDSDESSKEVKEAA